MVYQTLCEHHNENCYQCEDAWTAERDALRARVQELEADVLHLRVACADKEAEARSLRADKGLLAGMVERLTAERDKAWARTDKAEVTLMEIRCCADDIGDSRDANAEYLRTNLKHIIELVSTGLGEDWEEPEEEDRRLVMYTMRGLKQLQNRADRAEAACAAMRKPLAFLCESNRDYWAQASEPLREAIVAGEAALAHAEVLLRDPAPAATEGEDE